MRRADLAAGWLIARRVLRQRIRDRSALMFAVVTPLALALAFSALIPNQFSSFHTTFSVVDEDGGTAAHSLVDDALARVAVAGVADITRRASEADALEDLQAERAGAAIVIPAGFSAAVSAGQPARIRVIGGRFPVSLEIARAVVETWTNRLASVQVMLAATGAVGQPVDAAVVARAVAALDAPDPIQAVDDVRPLRQAGLATFYGAAMAIMFVFFATQYGALAIHADRQAGTLSRLLAAPIAPAAVLLGASLAGFLLGLLAMTVLVIATTLIAHASWGDPAAVAILVLGAVIAAGGISLLASTFARTPQQAGGLNAIIAISLAAIGGVFIPLSQAPTAMATIAQITPHFWFLRGIDTLADPFAGVADVLASVGVLLAMGAVLGAAGIVRARRSLAPA